MLVRFKINRFDPGKDLEPYSQEIEMELEGHEKILDVLLEVFARDPSLSFRRSCRSAICGSCAVRVNGTPALACHTLVKDVVGPDSRITLDPLPGFRQLKDLVVDLDPFFEALRAVVPWLVGDGVPAQPVTQAETALLQRPATCILCGACEALLPATLGSRPAAVVKGCRLALDSRDRLGATRVALMNIPREVLQLFLKDLGDACPRGVDIPEEILTLSP